MGWVEQLLVVVLLTGLAASGSGLVHCSVRLGRAPDDPGARFAYTGLATCAFTTGLACLVGLAVLTADHAGESRLALAGAVVANLVAQPVLLLLCWTGVRKLTLGLSGHVAYAWRRVTEEQLAGASAADRRMLSRYNVVQGAVVLPLGAGMSAGCALPLLRWAGLV